MEKKVLKFKKKNQKNYKKGLLLSIGAILGVVLIGYLVFLTVFLPWKDVYFSIGDNRVTYDEMNYQVYLAAKTLNAPLPNLQSTDPKELASSRNVLQLSYVNAISDAILYNKGIKDGITISQDEINSYINDLKERVSKGYSDKEVAFEDFLNTIGVNKNALPTIISKILIANKEKDVLTKDITVSREEVISFYNDFWNAYVQNESEKNAYLNANYEKVKNDALKNKKEDYVNHTLRRNLINDELNNIKIDNPYKQLMRFWYGTFLGTNIPDIYKAVSVQELLQ